LVDDRTHANLPKAAPWICITDATQPRLEAPQSLLVLQIQGPRVGE
jgi:hypothetical protein